MLLWLKKLMSFKENENLVQKSLEFPVLKTLIFTLIHWRSLAQTWRQKCHSQWHVTVTTVLALASLGDVTQIEMILIAKASKECNISLQRFHQQLATIYTSLYEWVKQLLLTQGEKKWQNTVLCNCFFSMKLTHLSPGVNVIKLFSFDTDYKAKYARVFVTGNHFPV